MACVMPSGQCVSPDCQGKQPGDEQCGVKMGKRIIHGVKKLFRRSHSTVAATATPTVDWKPKGSDSSSDDLVLGAVLQTLRLLLSSADISLALFFLDNLSECEVSKAKLSCKRDLFDRIVSDFARTKSDEIGTELAFELLCVERVPHRRRRSMPKLKAGATPPGVVTHQMLDGAAASVSLRDTDSTSSGVDRPSEDKLERSGWERWSDETAAYSGWERFSDDREMSAGGDRFSDDRIISKRTVCSSPSKASTALPHNGATDRSPFGMSVRTCFSTASSSEVPSPDASPSPRRRGPSDRSASGNRGPAQRGSHHKDRSSHDQDAQRGLVRRGRSVPGHGREGVRSVLSSADNHPDFDNTLSAELQQYNVNRVLRLGRFLQTA